MISHIGWETLISGKLRFSYFSGGGVSVLGICGEHLGCIITYPCWHLLRQLYFYLRRSHPPTQATAKLPLVLKSHPLSQLLPGPFQVHGNHCSAPMAPRAQGTLLDIWDSSAQPHIFLLEKYFSTRESAQEKSTGPFHIKFPWTYLVILWSLQV